MVRVGRSRQAVHTRGIGCAIAMLGALAAGCKSGSWAAKPSWWSFGGAAETSSLATAPSFDKDIVKPSESAKPYPTTSTPDGYALTGATATDPGRQAAAATPAGLVAPSTVTYGTTSPAAPPAQPAPATTVAAAPTAIGPQVGPYAGIQPQPQTPPPPGAIDPAAAATAGLAAAPAFGAAEAPLAQPPAARYADARPVESWAASPPPPAAMQPAPPAAVPADSRYGQATSSRFGAPAGFEPGPVPPPVQPPATAPLEPAWTTPPATTAPTILPSPAGGSEQLPGGMTPPQRRPDPGYRPGGTSSYRPSRTILASEEPPAAGVTPASFEAPAAGR